MEAAVSQTDDDDARLIESLPAHVVAALDHLTPAERAGVRAALEAFTRGDHQGERIPDPEPLYLLWATPTVSVIVRRAGPEAPVEVEDIVRPATLRTFAAAHGG